MDKESELELYRNYVCTACWKQLGECNARFKPYHLTFIDVGIQDIVRTLNNKGYRTGGCCEGHNNNGTCTYVSFYDRLSDYAIANVPDGFKIKDNGSSIVSEYYKYKSDGKFEMVKAKRIDALREWADSLPVLKDSTYNHEPEYEVGKNM